MMTESVWTRGNIAALAAIVIIAAGVIVTADYFVPKQANGQMTPPSAAELQRFLLDKGAISAVMDGLDLKEASRGGYLGVPGVSYSTVPAECIPIDYVGNAVAYAESGWTGVRSQGFTEVGGQSQSVDEFLVAVPSDRGRQLIDSAARAWVECGGKTYTTRSDGTDASWFVQEINQSAELLTATAKYTDSEWFCEHVLSTRSGYVAEVRVCGRTRGKAQTIAEKIVGNVNF
jgi:hypothetical protein